MDMRVWNTFKEKDNISYNIQRAHKYILINSTFMDAISSERKAFATKVDLRHSTTHLLEVSKTLLKISRNKRSIQNVSVLFFICSFSLRLLLSARHLTQWCNCSSPWCTCSCSTTVTNTAVSHFQNICPARWPWNSYHHVIMLTKEHFHFYSPTQR